MDARAARRATEKAARDLIRMRATVVGDLAVASAAVTAATTGATAAREGAEDLLRVARERGQYLVAARGQEAVAARADYATRWDAAVAAGWQRLALEALGYEAPRGRARPRPASASAAAADRASAPPSAR